MDQTDAASNPFESPQHGAASARRKRPLLRRRQLPTPAELMTLGVSVFLALAVHNASKSQQSGDFRTIFVSICMGITLAAIPLLLVRIKSPTSRGHSPGDWLWLAFAWSECVYLSRQLAPPTVMQWYYPWGVALTSCLIALGYVIPLALSKELRWRTASLILALWNVYSAAAVLLAPELVSPANYLLAHFSAVVCMVVAAVIDWRSSVRRSWSHWCGLLVFSYWMSAAIVPFVSHMLAQ
jgi:hypothetical protein